MWWTARAPGDEFYNFAIARSDLPDDLVYQIVKAVHENQPPPCQCSYDFQRHPSGERCKEYIFAPSERGAYYREIGMSILDSLVPTN